MDTFPKITPTKLSQLTQEHVDAECAHRNKKPESVIFDLLYESPAVMWVAYDWDSVRYITQRAIAVMIKTHTYLEAYRVMLGILSLYESVLANYVAPVEPIKRLAIFVNEVAETLLEDEPLKTRIAEDLHWDRTDKFFVRGKMIALITSPSCRKLLLDATDRYFFSELAACGELPAGMEATVH